ncbi:MAG TPA: cytochrome b [Novosphingobium sp.]|nr:cytochrome b [Novosphingobium sp.]
MDGQARQAPRKYPLAMRLLHWLRAALILGLIASGWYMTSFPEQATPPVIYEVFYPNHTQFGVLVWLLAVLHLAIRWRNRAALPQTPDLLKPWEKMLSHFVHRAIIALTLAVPLLGYAMSSSFTQSDGVPFFGFGMLPELLPKNDRAFAVFGALHAYGAFTLLGLVALHVAGTVKHRLHDKGGETDVLPRML